MANEKPTTARGCFNAAAQWFGVGVAAFAIAASAYFYGDSLGSERALPLIVISGTLCANSLAIAASDTIRIFGSRRRDSNHPRL